MKLIPIDVRACPHGNPCTLNHRQGMPGNKHRLCICADRSCPCHSQERYMQEKRQDRERELDRQGVAE